VYDEEIARKDKWRLQIRRDKRTLAERNEFIVETLKSV
jgi:hypothetical protein